MGIPEPLCSPVPSRCLLNVCFAPNNMVTPLVLDGAPITSLSDAYYSYNLVSQEYGMTKTSAVIAGTHTIALLCTGLLNTNYTNLVMQATGRGMSAIVLY